MGHPLIAGTGVGNGRVWGGFWVRLCSDVFGCRELQDQRVDVQPASEGAAENQDDTQGDHL